MRLCTSDNTGLTTIHLLLEQLVSTLQHLQVETSPLNHGEILGGSHPQAAVSTAPGRSLTKLPWNWGSAIIILFLVFLPLSSVTFALTPKSFTAQNKNSEHCLCPFGFVFYLAQPMCGYTRPLAIWDIVSSNSCPSLILSHAFMPFHTSPA